MSDTLKILWKRGTKELFAFGRTLMVSCDVRNEINGRRKNNEVVVSIPEMKPYQPRLFPVGSWEVGQPLPREDPYKAPFFIPTNAYQYLPVWDTKDNHYVKPTTEITRDEGYGLHFSVSSTTLGCIKVANKQDLLWLCEQIIANKEHKILLEVY